MFKIQLRGAGRNFPAWVPALVGAVLVMAGTVAAQVGTLSSQPLLNTRSINHLLEVDGRLYGGLDAGGLVTWDVGDWDNPRRIFADGRVSGNYITDMAWSGRYLWVATADGGLTRIADPGGAEPEFRAFSSSIGGTNLTAVTAAVVNNSEVVYYAMDGAGIGRIIDGLPGNIYTQYQDGLCSDDVTALALYGETLFVGTPVGICRFVDNTFVESNDGLGTLIINDFCLDGDGRLLVGTEAGIYYWAPAQTRWQYMGVLPGQRGSRLAYGPAGLYALGLDGLDTGYLNRFDGGTTWTQIAAPYTRTRSLAVGTSPYVGGQVNPEGMVTTVGYGYLGLYGADEQWTTRVLDASMVANATGVTYGRDGSPWIGSHNATGFCQQTEDGWFAVYELASADNDSSGLFDHGSNIVAMGTGMDGTIYAGQLSRGVVRHDPQTRVTELMHPTNCGLEGRGTTNIMVHPDGTVFFMHDWRDINKVEILVNPAQWRNPNNWDTLPMGEGGLGTTAEVYAALVERNDVIWFAVAGVGLVRWDINGDAAGPNDPLTWLDTSDDRWDDPVSDLPRASNDPKDVRAMALAEDGTIWVGGNGLARFHYTVSGEELLVVVDESFSEKTSPYAEGVVDGNVVGVNVDADGAVWVLCRSGLNRGVTSGGDTYFSAYFDPGNYLANSSFAALYSFNAVIDLPGGEYRRMVISPDGEKLLISSDRGAAELTFAAGDGSGAASAMDAYFYPSPYKPAEGSGFLKLGGIAADADRGDPAEVQIYNLEGQLIFENLNVTAHEGFWDGRNIALERSDVVSGMYIIRIKYGNQTVVKSLAVVR